MRSSQFKKLAVQKATCLGVSKDAVLVPMLSGSAELGLQQASTKPAFAQVEELGPSTHLDSLDPKQQICFDFTKGLCTRGDACKYSHDIALIVKVNSQERGICFDFLRGQCSRGLLCRFSHDLSNITSQTSQVRPHITIDPCRIDSLYHSSLAE